ncbi:MAG: isoprenyl transferase [Lachnospiraceae bacterium]|jgi:undecaprenyl diphosphate synthase|nr:isoprenyl transferase [Lachnospiraceae bacterium]
MDNKLNIPKHVAIILDGNGRWAKSKGLPRNAGHVQGARVVEDMCEIVWNKGIEYFTVYAFSTENWSRPDDEVAALMKLLRNYMVNAKKRANKNNMCVRVIGDKTGLDKDLQDSIADLEQSTAGNTGLHFQIAINYGGRDEIVRAVRGLASDAKEGKIDPADIDAAMLNDRLDTGGLPDPDLLIRTCGEQRISNFLLWQLAYTEFYFCDAAWPDFNEAELDKAIESYNKRDRKYGGLKNA